MTHKKSHPEEQLKSNNQSDYNPVQSQPKAALDLPIAEYPINRKLIRGVDARSLHSFLEVVTRFHVWVSRRVEEYGFIDGEDFCSNLGESIGGRKRRDYYISLDMAKELAMVERTEKGKQARRYFIKCETELNDLRQAQGVEPQYLPYFHECHDRIAALVKQSGSTTPAKIHHMNIERLINRTFSLMTGERKNLPRDLKLHVTNALRLVSEVYGQALADGLNHKVGYQKAKDRLGEYVSVMCVPVSAKVGKSRESISVSAGGGR